MRKLLVALSATSVVLVVTGLYQAFRYRPTAASAWGMQEIPLVSRGVLYDGTEFLHRWSAYLLVALLVATAVARAVQRAVVRTWSAANVALAVAAGAAVAGVVTGPKLRWDQLALWAVTVGSDIRGVFHSDDVKYVLRGTHEVALDEYQRTVWLHVAVFPIVIVGALVVLWLAVGRRRTNAPEPESVEVTA